ncbi:unnamed protein product [Lactuca virosa]|uniref:Uncharacterized protein n=1 Tax=Lactuca virosa TaxID=75947 RepID=A0AAU9PMH1_9ASTR|nr:unnamed protein product [Lactuca virosa]
MGQDLELDFEKYCVVDASPKTVLPSPHHHHHSNLEKRKVRKKPKPKLRNEVSSSLSQNKEFTEITFNRYRSASCRTAPSIRLQVDEEAPRRDEDTNNNSVNSVNKENLSISIPLHKSLSSRLSIPQSPTKSETDSSSSSKTRFSPFRKMFDPFTKSKSHKIEEPNEATSSRKTTLRKSLLNDFSNTDEGKKKDSCSSILSSSSSSSAAHLSGILKVRNKNGMPYFEFSVKNPHDVWVAKTWNMGDGFNWVYTFHMAQNRRSSNVSGHGSSKDHHHHHRNGSKEFLMMAQMQVSCYLCTELINPGAFNNSMLTEFVLYDLTRPKETQIDQEKVNNINSSNSNPWPVKDLHPDLETAAIVLQFPLKNKEGDMRNHDLVETSTPTRVNVVIPSGNHGLPLPGGEGEARGGASRLLDRWRMGGGCDCGGWDMGCPLVVFGNHHVKTDVEIFFKGSKEKMPGLTMKLTEEGQYVVDFHAQLSSLQAFSICVAMLHGTEASIVACGGDVKRKILKCDSLRVFIEDEVKHLMEAMAEGQKGKSSKNVDEILSTFVVNPPFSPMSRA